MWNNVGQFENFPWTHMEIIYTYACNLTDTHTQSATLHSCSDTGSVGASWSGDVAGCAELHAKLSGTFGTVSVFDMEHLSVDT